MCKSKGSKYSLLGHAEFFRDLDIVPSDIIAGLVLLRQRQRAKRNAVLDEVSPRAGHVPTLPSTEAVPVIS